MKNTLKILILLLIATIIVSITFHTVLYAGNANTYYEAITNENQISNLKYYLIWALVYFVISFKIIKNQLNNERKKL